MHCGKTLKIFNERLNAITKSPIDEILIFNEISNAIKNFKNNKKEL